MQNLTEVGFGTYIFRSVFIQTREIRVWEQTNDSDNIILLYPPCDDT